MYDLRWTANSITDVNPPAGRLNIPHLGYFATYK